MAWPCIYGLCFHRRHQGRWIEGRSPAVPNGQLRTELTIQAKTIRVSALNSSYLACALITAIETWGSGTQSRQDIPTKAEAEGMDSTGAQ